MQIQACSTPSRAGEAAGASSRRPWGHGSSCVISWRREVQATSHCQVQRAACAHLGQRSEEPHSPNPRPSEHWFEQQATGCDQSPRLNGVPVHCPEGSDRRAPLTKPPDPQLRQQATWRLDVQDQGIDKWVLVRTLSPTCGWSAHGLSSVYFPKSNLSPKKIMVTVWWSAAGLIHSSFLNPGRTIISETYAQQTNEMLQKLQCLQPMLVNRKGQFSTAMPDCTSHNRCFKS